MGNDKQSMGNNNASLKQVFGELKQNPRFYGCLLVALLGIVVVFAGSLFTSNVTQMITGIIGCLISFSGFDTICKLVAIIQKDIKDRND
jgi:hypothetical protein